jgi:hypothetical protein
MNKNNMKHIYKITTIALITGVLGTYTQCVPETKIESTESVSAAPSPVKPPLTDPGEIIQALEVSSGVKNYEELLVTYSELTGIPATTGSIRAIYDDVKVSLPTDSEMKSYLSGHQVAVSKLAAEYCNEMVNNTGLRLPLFSAASYAKTSTLAFNQAGKDELNNNAMNLFWGPSASPDEKLEMKDILDDLIDDLLIGEPNSTATTLRVVKSVCTATLASMHVTAK